VRAVVAGAAPRPGGDAYYAALLSQADVVVAADAAAEWCVALGRTPDVAVGDFDSAVRGAPERLRALGIGVVAFPAEKDSSDLELAVVEARRRGTTSLALTAASSLRLDHTLATLGLLSTIADLAGEIAEPDLAVWALDGEARPSLRLGGHRGATVSVFAVGGRARGVTLEGLRYPLTGATLEPLSGLGLSNEIVSDAAVVRVEQGRLLVMSPGPPASRAVLV
jgi:thiamine pyrophosphokinase